MDYEYTIRSPFGHEAHVHACVEVSKRIVSSILQTLLDIVLGLDFLPRGTTTWGDASKCGMLCNCELIVAIANSIDTRELHV